jgi:hypothetical protein
LRAKKGPIGPFFLIAALLSYSATALARTAFAIRGVQALLFQQETS